MIASIHQIIWFSIFFILLEAFPLPLSWLLIYNSCAVASCCAFLFSSVDAIIESVILWIASSILALRFLASAIALSSNLFLKRSDFARKLATCELSVNIVELTFWFNEFILLNKFNSVSSNLFCNSVKSFNWESIDFSASFRCYFCFVCLFVCLFVEIKSLVT